MGEQGHYVYSHVKGIIEEAMSLMKPAAIKEAIRGGKYQT
jgi:hypothetical protein